MQSVTLPRKPRNFSPEANIANQCRDFKPAVCACRLDDLAVDSDEEVDYSKMDQVTADHSIPNRYASLKRRRGAVAVSFGCSRGRCGLLMHECLLNPRLSCFLLQGNKKGPLGRWDFDTQEEYSDYMNNKEALPKYVLLDKLCSFSLIRSTITVKAKAKS